MMPDSKNSLTDEQQKQIKEWVEALPAYLQGLEDHIKVALVLNGYRALKNFPSSVESPRWNDLKDDCGLSNAQRNEVIDALFPSHTQKTGK